MVIKVRIVVMGSKGEGKREEMGRIEFGVRGIGEDWGRVVVVIVGRDVVEEDVGFDDVWVVSFVSVEREGVGVVEECDDLSIDIIK